MAISDDEPTDFRGKHRGEVLTRQDAGYGNARRVWKAMIDRRPAVIARPRGAADVIECVQFARRLKVPIAVRGGGHNIVLGGTHTSMRGVTPMRNRPQRVITAAL